MNRRTAASAALVTAVLCVASTASAAPGVAAPAAGQPAPPTVELVRPGAGWGYDAPATISLHATATSVSSTITTVEFFHGDTLIGTDTAAPYELRYVVSEGGTHRFSARATDAEGLTATSAEVAVEVTIPATVTLRGRVDAGVEAGCLIMVSNGVTYELHGGKPDVVKVGAWLAITGRLLQHSASFCQQGQFLQVTEARPYLPVGDPPTVSLVAPVDGQVFDIPARIVLRADAVDLDGRIDRVEFHAGDRLLGRVVKEPYTLTLTNVTAPSDALVLFAVAYDDTGFSTVSDSVTVKVSPPPARAGG